jgi:hypothetical protein
MWWRRNNPSKVTYIPIIPPWVYSVYEKCRVADDDGVKFKVTLTPTSSWHVNRWFTFYVDQTTLTR